MTTQARLKIGKIEIDVLTFAEALDTLETLVSSRRGAYVVTPNVDHVVQAEHDERLQSAYRDAALSLVDGQPLVWASRVLGARLPEKISGSDLLVPLMQRASKKNWRVYLLGGAPGVAHRAAIALVERHGVLIVGTDAPQISADGACPEAGSVFARLTSAQPDLLLVALGAPKQELWMQRFADRYAPAVAVGVGAALDFAAGVVKRAPSWMSRFGLEWAYRLAQEPRRLWRRYLLDDPKFLMILAKTLRQRATAPQAARPAGALEQRAR